jgi:hypothetical protein
MTTISEHLLSLFGLVKQPFEDPETEEQLKQAQEVDGILRALGDAASTVQSVVSMDVAGDSGYGTIGQYNQDEDDAEELD